jgi:hypothetical protein
MSRYICVTEKKVEGNNTEERRVRIPIGYPPFVANRNPSSILGDADMKKTGVRKKYLPYNGAITGHINPVLKIYIYHTARK